MHDRTIAEQARALAAGEVSSVELTEAALGRIEATNGEHNAFISVTRDAAPARPATPAGGPCPAPGGGARRSARRGG